MTPDVGLIFGAHACTQCLRNAATQAGVPKQKAEQVSAYDVRHALITLWAEQTPNLPGIGYLAGHKHATTTEK